jgi:hypothetical protein
MVESEQPAQPLAATDRTLQRQQFGFGAGRRRIILSCLMRPLGVVVRDELCEDVVQALLAEDDEVIQALDLERLRKRSA